MMFSILNSRLEQVSITAQIESHSWGFFLRVAQMLFLSSELGKQRQCVFQRCSIGLQGSNVQAFVQIHIIDFVFLRQRCHPQLKFISFEGHNDKMDCCRQCWCDYHYHLLLKKVYSCHPSWKSRKISFQWINI